MPKIKTRKAAAKRYFKITGTGKVKRNKAGKNHILNKKDRKTKRNLRKGDYVSVAEEKTAKKLVPYR